MNRFFKTVFCLLFLSTLAGVYSDSFAATDPPYIKRLDGAKGQIKKDSLVTVSDANFYNSGLTSWITKPYYERNIVTLKINEDSMYYLPSPFTATVIVKITYLRYRSLTDSSVIIRNDTLTVNYDSTKTYTGIHNFIFDSAQQVQVKITKVTISNTTLSSQVLKSLILETQIQPYTNYTWSCSANIDTTIAVDNNTNRINSTGELLISWPNVFGADEYDLEWSFIDQVALNDSVYGNPAQPDSAFVAKVFANNATRITTSNLSYGIPLIFPDAGTLFIRVRPVQIKSDGTRITSIWSSKYLQTGLGKYYFTGHETGLNWQSSVTFAEDGKRKVVVQYYDGTLRSRQTVTKDNSNNFIDVAETFYDYQGRPVIQVLPVPTLSNAIKYSKLFNVANSGEYDKHSYDTLYSPSNYCNSAAPPMSTASGASYYYSSSNPNQTGLDRFIPNAHGYVFTETKYTQDNTGRISKQSGVDSSFKLGTGHETKYYYATPDQDELDALFGTEVGDKSHYFKNAVQDANGQFSVSYVDMHGRTIATALAGDSIPGMDTLKSFARRDSVVETLSDATSTVIKDLTMESHRSLLVTGAGNYEFKYHLDPQSFTSPACDNSTVCYNCLYDLTITITDDCNNQKLPGSKPYSVTIQKGSLAAVNDTCNKNSIRLDTTFSIYLSPGTYEITKQLSVSKYADDFYKNNVFMTKNACTTKDQFIQQARSQLNTQCAPTYTACRDSLGTFAQFYSRYISAAGIDPATTDTTGLSKIVWQTYVDGQKACYELGDTAFTVFDDIKREMLFDVTAPYGQYANPDSTQDVFSIFHVVSGQTYLLYQTPGIIYLNEYGNPDTVVNDLGQRVTPDKLDVQQFARKFKTSWADSLLKYHPEYCKLHTRLENYQATLLWNKDFEKTDSYAAALSKGYINPFSGNTTTDDPLGTLKNSVKDKWQTFIVDSGKGLSMEQWAVLNTKCTATDHACISTYFNTPKNIADITTCTGEADMAWRNYRSLYLATKKKVIDSLVNAPGCNPTTKQILSANRFPHFNRPDSVVNQNGLAFFTGSYSVATLTDSANNRMDSFYTQNCRSYAQLWLSQLKTCVSYPLSDINNIIIPQLVAVCVKGSDVNHPLGSRNISPDSSLALGQFSTFDDVINNYNSTHGITTSEYCNADLITYPGLFGKQNLAVDKVTYAKPDTCVCNKINQLYAEYSNYTQYYSSISDFLLKRYKTIMSDADFYALKSMCSGTDKCNFLLNPITLPPLLQCGSTSTCVNCAEVTTLYDAFKALYHFDPTRTETDTAQQRKNRLFESYMNTRLGFNKQTWEYLDFKDKCAGVTTSKCVSCDSLQSLINAYFNQSGVYGGSEAAMLTYINTQLTSKGLITDTSKIKLALQTCNIGWQKNIAFSSGSILTFKGEDQKWDSLVLGHNLDIGANASNFSIEFWANLLKNPSRPKQPLLSYGVSGSGPDYNFPDTSYYWGFKGYFVNYTNGALYFGMSDNHLFNNSPPACFRVQVRTVSSDISAGQWHHIVIRRTGSGKYASDISIYIDDSLYQTSVINGCDTLATGNIDPGSDKTRGLMIFSDSYSGGNAYSVPSVKNLRLYNRALNVSEIDSNFRSCDGIPARFDSLRLWAKFNEGEGRAQDYSGYNTPRKYMGETNSGIDTTLQNTRSWNGLNGRTSNNSCVYHFNNILCSFPDTVLLCGNSTPYISNFNQTTNCSDSAFFAASLGIERYTDYTDSLRNNFDSLYHAKCLQAFKYESFTVKHSVTEFHYTLYYYDQAGNLIKTVPPQGVVPNRNSTWLQQVKTARANGTTQVPAYFFTTEYRYNSLNQVIAQTTPDAGQSKFFYDRLGRLVLSQNSKQSALNNYSYTKYDNLGRITEVGQIRSSETMDRSVSRTQSQIDLWFTHADTTRTEITQTHYDQGYYVSLSPIFSPSNLRNRVSWTAVYKTKLDVDTLGHTAATFYSYDIHGNVDTLLQDYKGWLDSSNRFKKIVYDYDLISGKVNQVSYQPGKLDQFYHRYTYDAENRLTDVETSSDQLYWEHDAFYNYYKHGPLNRMLLGKQQVQGIDYAYTLQGWLKGINSTSLMTGDDMGGDGKSAGGVASNPVAKDVLGYALEYYGYSDYEPISSSKKPFANGYVTSGFKSLYNGNIAGISLNIQGVISGNITTPVFYNYTYDQLNRLTREQSNTGLNANTNTWSITPQNDYKENVSYDPNGNIIGYLRNGDSTATSPRAMDSLVYHYYYVKTNGQIKTYVPSFLPTDAAKLTNKLAYISDTVNANNYTVDIDNQSSTTNYLYDSIGNLTKDTKEAIDSIYWNVYGKITQINKHDGTVIKYSYDAAGNRISKIIGTKQTFYVRDASGNVMSIYTSGDTANSGHLTQSEVHLYGSSRLGILRPNIDMTVNLSMPGVGSKYFTTFIRGRKFFEITNHLGNVLVTITDKKTGIRSTSDTSKVNYYLADIASAQDYYPFGMQMPGRTYQAGNYRI
ncbi:MAG: hypothetical protein U0U33_20765 [Chitinophagaceae bacterium]